LKDGCVPSAPGLSRHADTAGAMDYMLKRWPAFTRFLGDGRSCLTNKLLPWNWKGRSARLVA
jgi:hypothetical protein